jgi:hypothetical protein
MDCRIIPGPSGRTPGDDGMTTEGLQMKFGPAKLCIALLLAAPLLSGCLERGQPTMVDTSTDDDATCRARNFAVGSPEYVACRKDRDVARANFNDRTDRRQRNLGEYMLNNPSVPK